MKALRVLSLVSNNISTVPLGIGYLDNLRIIKLSGNPLNDGLRQVVDGIDGTPSPMVAPIAENEKDANLTKRVKKYLKAEAASLESGGESRSVLERRLAAHNCAEPRLKAVTDHLILLVH